MKYSIILSMLLSLFIFSCSSDEYQELESSTKEYSKLQSQLNSDLSPDNDQCCSHIFDSKQLLSTSLERCCRHEITVTNNSSCSMVVYQQAPGGTKQKIAKIASGATVTKITIVCAGILNISVETSFGVVCGTYELTCENNEADDNCCAYTFDSSIVTNSSRSRCCQRQITVTNDANCSITVYQELPNGLKSILATLQSGETLIEVISICRLYVEIKIVNSEGEECGSHILKCKEVQDDNTDCCEDLKFDICFVSDSGNPDCKIFEVSIVGDCAGLSTISSVSAKHGSARVISGSGMIEVCKDETGTINATGVKVNFETSMCGLQSYGFFTPLIDYENGIITMCQQE